MKKKYKNKKKSILFLGYDDDNTILLKKLKEFNCSVEHINNKVDNLSGYDLIISFGYKHILSKKIIETSNCDIINLHISYLPWNRGAHPNFWSFYDNTISGVTIHLINEGIDKGNIIYQKKITFNPKELTFFESYNILLREIELLFLSKIEHILDKTYYTYPQIGEGSFHKKSDLPENFSGWHSNIYEEIKNLKEKRF
tara:strand:- start:201 stop:794 length:594 start_codon:yes stop_codon:yes gene_type:complete